MNAAVHGPLSWQQIGRLRRDAARGERIPNLGTLFALPEELTAARLRDRLAEIMRSEDVLRITELSPDDGGRATYSADVEPPVSSETVDSLDELRALIALAAERPFPRSGGPSWSMTVVEHPDESGAPARTAWGVFDHCVSDGRSLHLLRERLVRPGAARAGGRYRDWVAWQLEQYPMDASGSPAPAREFWRRYLGGTAPDRSPTLPFCSDPAGPLSGTVRLVFYELPVTMPMLASAARAFRSSPFALFLGAVASAIAAAAEEEDVTVRVNTSGRPAAWLDTLGWLTDSVPIRVRHASLADPRDAVRAATSTWLKTLPYETTPWDYILATCGEPGAPPAGRRPPLVDVNFLPYGIATLPRGAERVVTQPGQLSGLQLAIAPRNDTPSPLACQFDPGRFDASGVDAFLDDVAARLAQICATT